MTHSVMRPARALDMNETARRELADNDLAEEPAR